MSTLGILGSPRRRSFKFTVKMIVLALVAPWTMHRRVRELSMYGAAAIAAISVVTAALLSTTLSTWTYLMGKGLVLGLGEMDLGLDDLPPDSVAQVGGGLFAAVLVWVLLLTVVLIVCIGVADALYWRDRGAFHLAVRVTAAASVWLVVWASAIIAANSIREGELNPVAAIRGYAQLTQRGFSGSSAWAPGPPERQPLTASGRVLPLAILFPVVWSIGLPASRGRRGPVPRWLHVFTAVPLCWAAWWAVWRLLPWIKLTATAG